MKYLLACLMVIYNLVLIAGTAYLIENHHWNPLWFIVMILFIMTLDLVERK